MIVETVLTSPWIVMVLLSALFVWLMADGQEEAAGIRDADRVLGNLLTKSDEKSQIVRALTTCRA